jgi:hypothetical protein
VNFILQVLFFMGGATVHGSIPYPEDAPSPRWIFLTNWLSRDINLRGRPDLAEAAVPVEGAKARL